MPLLFQRQRPMDSKNETLQTVRLLVRCVDVMQKYPGTLWSGGGNATKEGGKGSSLR
jgi:hypothetical protein